MTRDVYSSDEVRLIEQAVDTVLRDTPSAGSASSKERKLLAAKAFQVARLQDCLKLEPFIVALRTYASNTG